MAPDLRNRPDINSPEHTDNLWEAGERERLASYARSEGDSVAEAEQARLQQSGDSKKHTSFAQAFQTILKGNPHKNPIVLIIIALFGGGSIFAAILAPGVTLLSLADTLERDLNSQFSAWDHTSSQLWRAKLKKSTSGVCGTVKISAMPCRLATVNTKSFDRGVKKANDTSSGRVVVEYDKGARYGPGRGKITKFEWIEANGQVHDLTDGNEFVKRTQTDLEFRRAIETIHSPRFHMFKTQTTLDFMKKMGTSFSKKLQGDTPEEVEESAKRAKSGTASIDIKQPLVETDDDGNEVYKDPDSGRVLSTEEVEQLKQQQQSIRSSPTTQHLMRGLFAGALITGAVDTACSVYNMSRAVYTMAKVKRSQELIQHYMIYNTEAHAMRAEMATPATVEYASNNIQYMEPNTQIADESAMATTPAGEPLPKIDNPDAGKTGMDSRVLAVSASQDYPSDGFDASTQALMPGGGFTGTLGKINQAIASTLGADDPATITERCQIVQNPFVRTGALVIGIAAGIGTFGASTAASVAGSTLLAFAIPYLTAQLADMAAGRVTEGLKGMASVDAIAMGGSLFFNGLARENGLMTMSPEDMADYQNSKREALAYYDELDQQAALATPFDITNKFSFAGSLARTATPIATQIKSGGFSALASLGSIASLASSSLLPTTSADDDRKILIRPERYEQCQDIDYKALGDNVAVDPTCVMIFGLPKEGMNIDPIENAEWMLTHNEVVAGSDSGEPVDNGEEWNYMKYLEQCVDAQPGVPVDPEANPTNGGGCADEKNFDKNWHYAKFKLSYEVNLAMEQELPGMKGGAEDNSAGGQGEIGMDGWAYPTDKTKTNHTSSFGMRGGSMHYGVDLAGPLDTPIYAARDGKVIAAGPASGFGNWIILQHDIDGKRVDTVYGHMATHGVLVKRGDSVKAGDRIGLIGNEGFSTGPHLHFEIWDGGRTGVSGGNGKAVDPQPYLDKAAAGGSDTAGAGE